MSLLSGPHISMQDAEGNVSGGAYPRSRICLNGIVCFVQVEQDLVCSAGTTANLQSAYEQVGCWPASRTDSTLDICVPVNRL